MPAGSSPPTASGGSVFRIVSWIVGILAAAGVMPASAQVQFENASAVVGVEIIEMTYGPTWGDYNVDGLDDVFVGNHYSGHPILLRNTGDGFVDELDAVGMARGGDHHGAAWGDANNDGLPELYIAVGGYDGPGTGRNEFWVDAGGTGFEDRALEAGITDSLGRGRFPYWIDANSDGWLDLFVGNECTQNQLFLNQHNGTFNPLYYAGGLGAADLWYAAWTRYDAGPTMDVVLAGGYTSMLRLYRNHGPALFEDITYASGLPASLSNVQGLCWIDRDNDGDQDLYVSRGWASELRDAILHNSRELRFHFYMPDDNGREDGLDAIAVAADSCVFDVALKIDSQDALDEIYLGARGVHPPSSSFTLWDGTFMGRPDFVAGEDRGCFIWQEQLGGPWFFQCSTDFVEKHFYGGILESRFGAIVDADTLGLEPSYCPVDLTDRLYDNQGDGTFTDVTALAGIDNPWSARTAISADFDNNGWPDLYVVNERDATSIIARNMPNRLFLNDGDGTFTECAESCGVDCAVAGTGASAAWGDPNNDGFPDLYVTNGWADFPFNLGPHVFYSNLGNANHWVKLRLIGTLSNRDATGALVRVVANGQPQVRVQAGGVNDMAQSTRDVLFGLGSASVIDTLTIDWPSGVREVRTCLATDSIYVVVEDPGASLTPIPPSRSSDDLTWTLQMLRERTDSDAVTLRYRLPAASDVRASVYDVAGRTVRTLFVGRQGAGEQALTWDGLDMAGRAPTSGVYYGRVVAGEKRAACPILIVN